ncbi:MAG TPA: hypothetical protein VMC43_00420 [Candidatus Paceibacterota bacterium]|nr:hypothetical protein [Candidatus Paceibacterota bacterium]
MHKHTKLAPALRREVYERWKHGDLSLRALAAIYHVDKRVVQRIIFRGAKGDFSVHDSTNDRYRPSAQKQKEGVRSKRSKKVRTRKK